MIAATGAITVTVRSLPLNSRQACADWHRAKARSGRPSLIVRQHGRPGLRLCDAEIPAIPLDLIAMVTVSDASRLDFGWRGLALGFV